MADAVIRLANAVILRQPLRRLLRREVDDGQTRVIWKSVDPKPVLTLLGWLLLASMILNVALVLALLDVFDRARVLR